MLCEICKRKEATFFIKETVLGETKTRSLCEDCARKYKDTMLPSNLQIEKLIQSLISFTEDELDTKDNKKVTKKQKNKKCPKCGSTYDEVVISKVAGCSYCYKTFASDIEELINKFAKDTKYIGTKKSSKKTSSAKTKKDNNEILRDYKKELNEAIKIEDYEKAAELRDKIKELENKEEKVTTKNQEKKIVKNTTTKKKGKKNDSSK